MTPRRAEKGVLIFPSDRARAEATAKRNKRSDSPWVGVQSFPTYAAAKQDGRLNADWLAPGTSADGAISPALRTLRFRSRQLFRDTDWGKTVMRVLVNNVIGHGINFQSQVKRDRKGDLDETINAQIETAWKAWTNKDCCDVSGRLHFCDLERLIFRAIVESGEVLIRFHSKRFGQSKFPLALEIIEADQLDDSYTIEPASKDHEIRMGVEVDKFKRPIAYWIRPSHPGDFRISHPYSTDEPERVPADEILHLFVADRPGQTRGVPWLHASMLRLRNMDGYESAELIAKRAAACTMGVIESPDNAVVLSDEVQQDGEGRDRAVEILEPGLVRTLRPGEKFTGFSPPRTSGDFEPYMRHNLRAIASSNGVTYESASGDYSQTNFSGSRMGRIEGIENYQILQEWFIREFNNLVFPRFLEAAFIGGLPLRDYGANPDKYCCPRWVPRGWKLYDPSKEVGSARDAIRAGLSTLTKELAMLGLDIEDVIKERKRELEMIAAAGLTFDSDPTVDLLNTGVQMAGGENDSNAG